ncbi:MAG TPA: 2-oxoacid:acceptor oxidoreductase family protein [Jatrophihabitans sp.]|jgi:pyruvate ferredoxin oxidoreductase gamma subunit|nr:2-oxoacid:acceptor oxidoreductase family protein [Jatrophihabitans sp.]
MDGAFEVRFHGRGGQGIVTAAELLSVAAFLEGREAQAFPSFGSERMGAPVTSFCRIADRPIRTHEPVAEPDAVVIADSTLLHQIDVFGGLRADGWVLIDSVRPATELGLGELAGRLPTGHLRTVAASELARTHLGRPLPNVCLLGALAALTGIVGRDPLHAAVTERFAPVLAQGNLAALDAAFTELTPTEAGRA